MSRHVHSGCMSEQTSDAGRSEGTLPVPPRCTLQLEHPHGLPACSRCGADHWGPSRWHAAKVILSAAVVSAEFEFLECAACSQAGSAVPGRVLVDGRGYGVLRFSEGLAFGLDVFYQWAHRIDIAAPSTWTAAWRHTLHSAIGLTLRERKWLYQAHKKHFDSAVLDFIQLQQIDYDVAFNCDCFSGDEQDLTVMSAARCACACEHHYKADAMLAYQMTLRRGDHNGRNDPVLPQGPGTAGAPIQRDAGG